MNRFKKILFVPSAKLTEPDESFKKTVKLAFDNGALLTVFGVINDNDLSNETVEELIHNERLPELGSLASYAHEHGVSAEFKLTSGIPFLKITQEVLKQGHDLVIAHLVKSSSVREWIFGSTNLHLLRKCPCPVWVMKPQVRENYRQILAAVDPCSPESTEADLNIQIVEIAASMAAREQGQLHLLHVWSHASEDLLRERGRMPASKLDVILREAQALHRDRFEQLISIAKAYTIPVKAHFLEGSPTQVIPRSVAELDIDLLVMGTIARTGIQGFLIGNTAEQVLEQVQCPLLGVKPDGFQTPVSLED